MSRKPTDGHAVIELPVQRHSNRAVAEPPRAANLTWLWVVLAAGGALIGGYFVYRHFAVAAATRPGPQGAREIPVVAVKAKLGDMTIHLTGLGSVVPLNTVTIRSRVDGELMKIEFDEGQIVPKGKVLFQIDPRPFTVQKQQAEAQLARDAALLANAEADLRKYEKAGNSVSVQERDNQKSLVDQAKAATGIDKAAIATAQLQIDYCTIAAPIKGRIGLRQVDQGNMVHANDPGGLAVITQLQPIAVVFNIAEDDLPRVMEAMKGTEKLPVEALDRDRLNTLATGTLEAIDSQIDPTSGTIKFKAQFANEDYALYPNQFVNARLLVETVKDCVIIPTAAVQRSPQATFVYVVKSAEKKEGNAATTKDANAKPEKSVQMRTIELGPGEGDEVSVLSGLEAGEVVVTDGVDKLQEGAKVSTTRPAGSPTTRGVKGKLTTRPATGPTTVPATHPATKPKT